ncbi:sigma-70 family RNA polymerase sigma factor [Streptomyces sp. TS71-3]|uniref:sigma-70 family RNA polymerase sigma factor n=1 Tax=Streptomyces sp. TS71-3 TaxID=2733862 RepID=UPI001B0B2A9C|nr:sigma-70 family RNA polymerase sigma factor [Streptomyces sp. TS71-3]GHJ40538.1 hypothetical protein Sm713_61470 [Streptomyces sp. TS71-3]
MSGDGRDESLGDKGMPDGVSVPAQRTGSGSTASDGRPGGASQQPDGAADPAGGTGRDPAGGTVPPPAGTIAPSDADLIARMRSGDDSAYEDLFRRHAAAVRRYARTCCRDAHTADDLTAEVFARMLQAVRGGAGPEYAVRAYLLSTVRRVAAGWTKSRRREELVDDFAAFAAESARGADYPGDVTVDLGADVLAMREAEQSLAMQAFRSLPERWQAVLWHTEVEDESPGQVATLFGLDANGARVLASRAREGLKEAYLQAHVSAALAADEECARFADRLGAYARGSLRARAERGLRKHLAECARCRLAAGQIKEVAGGIPGVVPVAVIGWFGAAGYAKVAALFAGGAAGAAGTAAGAAAGGTSGGASGTAGAGAASGSGTATGTGSGGAGGGSSAASGSAGSGSGGAGSSGLSTPVKAGLTATVAAAAAAVVALALVGGEATPPGKHDARPPASEPVPPQQPPTAQPPTPHKPGPGLPPVAKPMPITPPGTAPGNAAAPAAEKPPHSTPPTTPSGKPPTPAPTPPPTHPAPPPPSTPPAPPPPDPVPVVYQWSQLAYGPVGDGSKPEMRLGGSWVWQRHGLRTGHVRYAHGVTVHGTSSVTIDLNRSCSAYDALVGIDDTTLGLGAVRFSVLADGVRIWQSPVVKGGRPAMPVHVPLNGHSTVRLVVEPHGLLDGLILADWAESRFTCR